MGSFHKEYITMRSPQLGRWYSLYQKLKNVPKSVHFLAPEVRDLRAALRNACFEALEHNYSEAHVRPRHLFSSSAAPASTAFPSQ